MSQQRVHVFDASLPSAGFPRTKFPGFLGTIKALRLPAVRLAALRCLRLAIPPERSVLSLPPPPSADGRPGVGLPVPLPDAFFRGDDRISQVPGEPLFPFAHVLRPRPADSSPTYHRTFAWPSLKARRRRRRRENFRGSIAWLSGWLPTYYRVGYPSQHKAHFQVLVKLSWAGFNPQGSAKRFATHIVCAGLLFQAFLAQAFFLPLRCSERLLVYTYPRPCQGFS
jgi:hypothetical protein